ncbi:MCE family protein [Phaeodactylibacter luteus]|uniref:MCE family protein n=2 Tax=Phaeodactylibacter luteus TaxID=1564516 RepID=A0A5C6RWP4_9BACT|nr:MCE family protein [Phaeodactylibacter luteus]
MIPDTLLKSYKKANSLSIKPAISLPWKKRSSRAKHLKIKALRGLLSWLTKAGSALAWNWPGRYRAGPNFDYSENNYSFLPKQATFAPLKPNTAMSNEVKVGILAIVALAVSYWGYKFILGSNVLLKSNTYTVYYPQVDRMQVGTQVFINGVTVGSVADVSLLNDIDRTVKVVLDLNPDMTIPKDTRAVIVSTGFMGGKAVLLEYDKPCSGDDCAQSGDTLEGVYKDLLGSMVGEDAVADYMSIVQKGLNNVLDSLNAALLSEDSGSPVAEAVRNLNQTLANLNSSTGQLDRMLRASSGNIQGSLKNVEAITANLQANNEKISAILSNADSLSSQLVAADLQATIAEVNATIAQLKGTLAKTDSALGNVNGIVESIGAGEGSLGKLIKDEALYQNLNDVSRKADSLITDFQDRPYRYMPLKSRRKVEKYDRQDAASSN